MKNKTDVRVLKTKEKLNKALRSLLAEKGISDITVNEICDRAGIRRATFYKHYSDKIAFMSGVASDLIYSLDNILKASGFVGSAQDYLVSYEKKLISCLLENKYTGEFLRDNKTVGVVASVMVHEHCEFLKNKLTEITNSGVELVASADVVASILSGGIASLMIKCYDDADSMGDSIFPEIENIVRAMFR